MENRPSPPEADIREIEELRARLEEAEEAIRAIRAGEVDALVVGGPGVERVFTIEGADLAYRHLFEQMSEGAMVLDPAGLILFANGRVGEILAKPIGQVIGSSLAGHVSPRDLGTLKKLASGSHRGISQGELHLVRSDGGQVPVHASIAPYESGGLDTACLILTDLSARFQVEAELRQAREAAEAANRAKGQFLAHMSHEIRTPMNAILGMTELTLATDLEPDQKDNLELVRSATHALLSIIDDILDFSKIEAGLMAMESTEFDPRERVHAALDLLALRADAKGLDLACRFRPGVPARLIGDPSRLRQVLINLVGNAIKFTESGHVLVEVAHESTDEAGVVLRFSVTDTGVGIAPGKEGRIFDPFVQADDSTTRTHGGTGLGLTITSRLVDLMGGRIWVESRVGGGSSFRFTCRFALPVGPRSALPPVPERLRGLRILVAVASPMHARVLGEVLEDWGLVPCHAADGGAAWCALERARDEGRPFPVVLLEDRMVGPDGASLAGRLLDEPGLAGGVIPIASLATRQAPAGRARGIGSPSVLHRPVRQSELLAALIARTAPGPTAGRTPASPAAHRDGAEAGRVLRILLVEDHPINRKVASLMLERRGHAIATATNGREALELVLREPFDLVLMDVQMPEMDGLQATAAIRDAESGSDRHVPIIAMTAHAMKEDRDLCLEAGMDAYLSKPIHQDQLWSTIAGCLDQHPAQAPPRLRDA